MTAYLMSLGASAMQEACRVLSGRYRFSLPMHAAAALLAFFGAFEWQTPDDEDRDLRAMVEYVKHEARAWRKQLARESESRQGG